VAGRPRRPLWKRSYSSFRHGDKARPDLGAEPQRLTLYIPARLLDLAEKVANRSGALTIQLYCEGLLARALESERTRLKIEEAEAWHGPFEGLNAIADDPEYLAEWTASFARREGEEAPPITIDATPGLPLTLETKPSMLPPAFEAILRHAGLSDDNPQGFLPSLRRGEAPTAEAVEELAAALVELDKSLDHSAAIDRRLAHALHRLSLESQVLHTDAWPDAFDTWTIDAIRNVQDAVERVLSGSPRDY
jgi:hypothetical protein